MLYLWWGSVAHLFSFLCCAYGGVLLLISLVFCVVFMMGFLLPISLVFCVVFMVGFLLLISFVFCVVFIVGFIVWFVLPNLSFSV